jgi:DNA adenine methylase
MRVSKSRSALLRYPGGKGKAADVIVEVLAGFLRTRGPDCEYREPFFGAGAIGLALLTGSPRPRRVWFNDRDPAICCVWESLLRRPQELAATIGSFEPSVDRYTEFNRDLGRLACIADVADRTATALRKIALHRMSFSGLGTRAGGPIGGWEQSGDYGVGDRYRPKRLTAFIDSLSIALSAVQTHPDVCSCLDFEQVLRAPGDAIFYLDPPYFEKGPELYQFAFDDGDHRRLAEALRGEERPWLLSYDRHPAITELYRGWANLDQIALRYSINGPVKKSEYLISNLPLDRARLGTGLPIDWQADQILLH